MTEPGGAEPPVAQIVTAVNGFAYGVIAADIHVFDSGLPLYLLANWQPEPPASSAWLRELPSRMLNARRAVVPFTGRDGELADLRQWRDSGPRLAVRWLHGPGGQGKTRLAAQFAAESAATGWKVIAAFHGPDADPIEPGSQDMRLAGSAGLLMLVDYADRWFLTNMTWLFKNALLHQTGVATRVLLVARTADAWPRIRGILDTHQASTSSQPLTALAHESGERTAMFTTARDSFAAIYQLPGTAGIGPPGPLDDPEFGLTLAVHMAALVAVDAHVTGERLPAGMADLTMYLLDREQLHWARLYADGTAAGDAAGNTYHTPPAVMNQTVFTAALTGTVARATGTAVLESLRLPGPGQILADHAVCYPPDDSGQVSVLEPLYPDRLAEDFLALTMPGHPADYPAQDWAAPTSVSVLARQGDQHAPAAWTPRAITFLASAAFRWPHLGLRCLYPLLLDDPQLAVDAGNAALTAIAGLPSITPALLEAIESCLPSQRHIDLDTGIAALAQRLAGHRLATTHDPAEQARIHLNLGSRLYNAGLNQQGHTATSEAVDIYRQLAAANPAAFEPDLAMSLSNLGAFLSGLGRREEALAPAQEAVRIRRRLATANPAAYEPDLAVSLDNLGIWLSGLGRREEALAPAQEAVRIRRRLATANPAAFEPDLAKSMNNLGIWLSGLGRREEALAPTEEAVRIRRRLATANPAAFEPDLATSLSNLGVFQSGAGRREEALAPTEEAARIRRRLATANPAAFEPDLAMSLNNLGDLLSALGRREEALTPAEEAAHTYRRLATANPAAFEPHLAMSLNNLGVFQSGVGRREEALAPTEEAVRIRRRLATANPAAFEPDLAASLTNLGARLSGLGRREEALAPTEEAAQTYRRLATANPAAFESGLAASANNLGVLLSEAGRRDEALAPTEEAVRIRRRLAQADPAAFEPDLAMSLSNLGARLSEAGRREEALAPAEEAAQTYRRLATANPAAYEPDLARSLSNLGVLLSGAGRREEALAPAEEAAQTYRRLATANPAAFEPDLATSLSNLSARLWEVGRREEALAPAEEAVPIRRRLARANPAAFEPDLAASLSNLGVFLSGAGRREEALALTEEAVQMYRRLAAANPAAYEPDLATSLSNLSARLSEAGRRPWRRSRRQRRSTGG